jgi:putative radical SAM enzyme (TIGR03279 family)
MAKRPGGIIASVEPGSVADHAGLEPGDELLSINDHRLRDIIDVQFYGAEETLEFWVARGSKRWRIQAERAYDQDLGLAFTNPTFDIDIRRCRNSCEFCFVKQNAPGMRRSLYIKDDDYRYSFLFGNFVTLTNLTSDDWARLEEQRLSPLYVSVHATGLELRRRFLGSRDAPDVLEQLRRLAELDLEVHTQVVLVPGLNDGVHLQRTLDDLASLYLQPVASVGIVPIGLTRYHPGECRNYTPEESRAVLAQVDAWHMEKGSKLGGTFVYPSDEWYLVAGCDIPPAEAYDDFPQLENGVGMVRQLLDEWDALKSSLPILARRRATLACGTLVAPVLSRIVGELNAHAGAEIRLVPVVNEYFGPMTTVSGLLTGQDLVAALQDHPPGELVLLPSSMFTGRYGAGSAPPGTTLDGWTLQDLSAHLGSPIEMAGTISAAIAALARQEQVCSRWTAVRRRGDC